MDAALAPHAHHLEVLAPLPRPDSSPLPQLRGCRRLRRLTLRHARAEALPALAALTALQALDATGARGGRPRALPAWLASSLPLARPRRLFLICPPAPSIRPPLSLRPVLFSSSDPGWLDWAAGLRCLQYLAVSAALLRLQPEAGLGALLPLRPRLRALRLDGCVLLTDAGAATLAQLGWARDCCSGNRGSRDACCLQTPALPPASRESPAFRCRAGLPPRSGLTRLEVTCCQASQAGLDALCAALPRLAHAELRLQDGVAGDRLGSDTAVGAGGGLAVHASRAKANSLVGGAGQQLPGLGRLAVRHSGCGFLLTAPPSFLRLAHLTALRRGQQRFYERKAVRLV